MAYKQKEQPMYFELIILAIFLSQSFGKRGNQILTGIMILIILLGML
jgi:hypothetical protein